MRNIIDSLIKNRSLADDKYNFFSEHDLGLKDCQIEIPGIGKLKFPIIKDTVEKLLKISSEAKYGHGEKTLLDKKVRNTQEITADKFKAKFKEKNFNKMLQTMKEEMGLPEDSTLKAHLHNMLVYTPGQFFKKHQDTEKLKGIDLS